MEQLRDRDIFRFCAIPQVMAIGTLALCYDNHAVFTGGTAASFPPPARMLLQKSAGSCRETVIC